MSCCVSRLFRLHLCAVPPVQKPLLCDVYSPFGNEPHVPLRSCTYHSIRVRKASCPEETHSSARCTRRTHSARPDEGARASSTNSPRPRRCFKGEGAPGNASAANTCIYVLIFAAVAVLLSSFSRRVASIRVVPFSSLLRITFVPAARRISPQVVISSRKEHGARMVDGSSTAAQGWCERTAIAKQVSRGCMSPCSRSSSLHFNWWSTFD